VPDRKSRFSKKSAKNSSIIFENLSGPEKNALFPEMPAVIDINA
jgi:hypothetical protein